MQHKHCNLHLLYTPTLFVEFRKRIGNSAFNDFSEFLLKASFPEKIKKERTALPNKGHLKLDATVDDQYIQYPNDLSLLNEAREKNGKTIDKPYNILKEKFPIKPKAYQSSKKEIPRKSQQETKKPKNAKASATPIK